MKPIPLNRESALPQEGLLRADVTRPGRPLQAIGSKYRYLLAHPGFRKSPAVTLARLLRWRLHCTLGIPANLSLPEWDARFYLPPRWHGAGTTMIYALRSGYENELKHLSRFISPGTVVVDAGASSGIYTVAAAKLVGPSGLILAFEPGAEAFSVLRKNVDLNCLQNVRIYRAALSGKEGKAALYHHKDGPNSFSLGSLEIGQIEFEEVITRTLSRVAEEQNIQRIGLIKLDVEGAEALILRDAEQLIARSLPVIILEMNGVAAQRLKLHPAGSWKVLENLGYEFFCLTESDDLHRLNRPPLADQICNVIAIHEKERK